MLVINAESRTYYILDMIGFNGSYSVFNDPGTEYIITPNSLEDKYYGRIARYQGVQKNGDKLYVFENGSFKAEYYVSKDNKRMARYLYTFNSIICKANFTASQIEQQQNYAKNKKYETQGIDYGSMNYESNSSSNRSYNSNNSRNAHSKANCPYCQGTGYFISPSSTSGSVIDQHPIYNSQGQKCRICGGFSKHWHHECKHM